MAVTDPDAEPHGRASLLIVPADTPGFRRVRNISCMGHAGDDWASHAELAFERAGSRARTSWAGGAGFAMAQGGWPRAGSTTRCDGSGSVAGPST